MVATRRSAKKLRRKQEEETGDEDDNNQRGGGPEASDNSPVAASWRPSILTWILGVDVKEWEPLTEIQVLVSLWKHQQPAMSHSDRLCLPFLFSSWRPTAVPFKNPL